jgi:hypothetical protein
MTGLPDTASARPPLGKRDALEGVARPHGRQRNPARMTPRSSLRSPSNRHHHSLQRWVENCDRSVANSETPQSPPPQPDTSVNLSRLPRPENQANQPFRS